MRIPLSSPDIDERDIEAVVSVLRTPHLSLGPKLREFEEVFASYIGVPYSVALSSGTAGLHIGLQALGVGEGDEVILPSFTFIAAANAIRYLRATPVFADIDARTLNISPDAIERAITPKTRALIVVHTFGYPAEMDPILQIARQHGLFVIEDACEAIGAEYCGRKIGSFGDVAVFSFYPNKPITTGEGGVVVTKHLELARKMRALRNQGRMENGEWLEHSLLGYNYRLPDINCALGISQLSRIDEILARREQLARSYIEALACHPEILVPEIDCPNGRICWFAFVVRVQKEIRGEVLRTLDAKGIGCRAYFPPIHLQPLYSEFCRQGQDLSNTVDAGSRTIALPFFNALTKEQVMEVSRVLIETVRIVSYR